jgi:hypothetical protein
MLVRFDRLHEYLEWKKEQRRGHCQNSHESIYTPDIRNKHECRSRGSKQQVCGNHHGCRVARSDKPGKYLIACDVNSSPCSEYHGDFSSAFAGIGKAIAAYEHCRRDYHISYCREQINKKSGHNRLSNAYANLKRNRLRRKELSIPDFAVLSNLIYRISNRIRRIESGIDTVIVAVKAQRLGRLAV